MAKKKLKVIQNSKQLNCISSSCQKECIDKKLLDNTLKVRIAVEVAHALNFIHKNNMIHRDVKVENNMLNSDFDAKVVDFGLI